MSAEKLRPDQIPVAVLMGGWSAERKVSLSTGEGCFEALKAAGFTKNMPQTMTLGKVTGLEAIAAIMKKYEKEKVPMVLVIDEGKKLALITTKDFAEKDSLKTYPLP